MGDISLTICASFFEESIHSDPTEVMLWGLSSPFPSEGQYE